MRVSLLRGVRGGWWSLAALALVAAVAGCNIVATGMYVLVGQNVPAEFTGLRGKKVAVVCRPLDSQYSNDAVAKDLARAVGAQLQENVRRVQVVKQRDVEKWMDENTWEEYVEIGKSLDADLVLGIDLEDFSLDQGQTLYQGRAVLKIAVYDVKTGTEHVWEKNLPQTLYPPTSAIPSTDKPRAEFRRQFVSVLAGKIARHFYDHDSTVDFANDSTAL
jgi:hypothetical protein